MRLPWIPTTYGFRSLDPAGLIRPSFKDRSSSSGHPSGMPPLWVYEAADGVLVVYDGVTRATRVAKLLPGKLIRVEVIGKLRRAYGNYPKIGDLLP